MVAFGVIGFLTLFLIYLVVRNQSLQRELNQYKHSLKTSDSQAKYTLNTLVSVSSELQKTFVSRIESAQKRGLLSGEDYTSSSFILNHVDYVIMQCCEYKSTVEEAINKALEPSDLSITEINQFIAKQPSEIRVPWCKNTVNGFVTACNNISIGKLNIQSADDKEASSA